MAYLTIALAAANAASTIMSMRGQKGSLGLLLAALEVKLDALLVNQTAIAEMLVEHSNTLAKLSETLEKLPTLVVAAVVSNQSFSTYEMLRDEMISIRKTGLEGRRAAAKMLSVATHLRKHAAELKGLTRAAPIPPAVLSGAQAVLQAVVNLNAATRPQRGGLPPKEVVELSQIVLEDIRHVLDKLAAPATGFLYYIDAHNGTKQRVAETNEEIKRHAVGWQIMKVVETGMAAPAPVGDGTGKAADLPRIKLVTPYNTTYGNKKRKRIGGGHREGGVSADYVDSWDKYETRQVVTLAVKIGAQAAAPERPPVLELEFESPEAQPIWQKVYHKGFNDSGSHLVSDAPNVDRYEVRSIDDAYLKTVLQQLENPIYARNSLLLLEGNYYRAHEEAIRLRDYIDRWNTEFLPHE